MENKFQNLRKNLQYRQAFFYYTGGRNGTYFPNQNDKSENIKYTHHYCSLLIKKIIITKRATDIFFKVDVIDKVSEIKVIQVWWKRYWFFDLISQTVHFFVIF